MKRKGKEKERPEGWREDLVWFRHSYSKERGERRRTEELVWLCQSEPVRVTWLPHYLEIFQPQRL